MQITTYDAERAEAADPAVSANSAVSALIVVDSVCSKDKE